MNQPNTRLINNDALFRHIYVIQQDFPIIPDHNNHIGASITYQDLRELREDFVNQLYDTIVDWVYSSSKYESLRAALAAEGKTHAGVSSEILRKASRKFRKAHDGSILVQGQFGELLLFHFLQRFFSAAPLLRKMPIATSSSHERFGADAIHYKRTTESNLIFLGEAKTYSSKYRFKKAFEDSIDSILDTYYKHRRELDLYVHEDFLDDDMNEIANQYLTNRLENVEIHLVSIVIYNETIPLTIDNEASIKRQIKEIITQRFESYNNESIPIADNPILRRINYILFPIWELEDLLQCFQDCL